MRKALVGLMVAFVATATPAFAESWGTSFDPATVATLATPGRTRVTLVAPGGSKALDRARLALGAAMKASGKLQLVDGDLVREYDEDMTDGEVVAEERDARDVQAIWILRLLPGKGGAPDDALVTVWSPLGPLLQAFQVAEGQPLRVVVAKPDLGAEYLRQRVSPVVDGRITTGDDFAGAGFAKDGVHLDDPRMFYVAVGRYDLLHDYDEAEADRQLATIISGGVVFVGAVLFMQDVFNDGGTPSTEIGALGISGIVAAGLGTTGVIVARLIDPDPVDHTGKVALATTYNSDLQQRLAPSQSARITSWGVAPVPGGLGLSLGLSF